MVTFSSTDICNRALQVLGANAITSLTETSRNARECALTYDKLRQSLLRSHNWNFATKFAQLVALAVVPNPPPLNSLWGNSLTFPLPFDFLKLVQVSPFSGPWIWEGTEYISGIDYILQSNSIVTPMQSPFNIRYVYDFTDTGHMDPIFQEALSYYMAEGMCERLTQSTSKKQTISAEFLQVMAEARRLNAFDKPAGRTPTDEWIGVRR